MESLEAYSDRFSEFAQWNCKNKQTYSETKISGPLAQILMKYPDDYELTFEKMKERVSENEYLKKRLKG